MRKIAPTFLQNPVKSSAKSEKKGSWQQGTPVVIGGEHIREAVRWSMPMCGLV
jgi:hypothetical protein